MSDAKPPARGWLRDAAIRLRRVVDPEGAEDRRQLRSLARAFRDWRTHDEAQKRDHLARLRAMEASVEQLAKDTAANQRDLGRVRDLASKQKRLSSEIVRHAGVNERAIQTEQRVAERLARFSRSRLPIIVGPWTGEVGFELLYWIPFLQWARKTFPFDTDRLIVISRGGVNAWYGHVSPHYEDVFRYVTTQQFQAETEQQKKQQKIRSFDRAVIKSVMRARGISRAHLLHPTLMYKLFNAFWRYDVTVKHLSEFAKYRLLPPVGSEIPGLSLPDQYVAVRFYFSDCFPDSPANRRFAARVVDGLASRGDVVLLNTDIVVDDHRDFMPANRSRVHVLSENMRPENNLALQTAAISRASAFVGTYGGYSYLAPLCGVSSVAFYERPTFKRHHLELAHRAFQRLGAARLVPVDVRQAEMLGDALAGILTTPALP